ncbi:hypothetical protein [Gemella morbillorum]
MSMLLSLTSCSSKNDEYKIKSKELNVISALSNSYENGLIYTSGGICNFYDYASDTSIPLCLKPNCTHNDKECISKILSTSGCGTEHAVIYEDNIYFFTETESIEGEGKDTSYNIQSVLHKCNLKSGEITDVLDISDLNCISSVNMVLNNDTIYFTASNGAYQFEDGTWLNAGFGKQYLCSVNLTDKNFENYGLVNDNEFASNNVIITENSINAVSDQVIISGVYNDKIYLYYSYVEDRNIIVDAIENNNYNIDWKYEVKEFDLNAKKLNTVHEAQPICLNNNWYVTENKSDKKVIATDRSGNPVEFDSMNELQFDCYQYSIYNDKVWDLYNGYVYDLSTKETFQISEDFLGGNIADYISNENKYVICNYDSNGNLLYSMIDGNILINK